MPEHERNLLHEQKNDKDNASSVNIETKLKEVPLTIDSPDEETALEYPRNKTNSMMTIHNSDNKPVVLNETHPDLTLMYPADMPEDYVKKYETFLEEIEQLRVPIMKTINKTDINTYSDYTTKFYTNKYVVDFNLPKVSETFDDIMVRIHTNGTLLICLAPGNTIMKSQHKISTINFKVNNKDRSKIKLKGKKKFGAMLLMKESILCQVQLEGSNKFYNIRSGVQGRLVEFNHLIKSNPNIMKSDPEGLGYICIVLPNAPKDKITDAIESLSLYNESEYADYLLQRKTLKNN